MKLYNTSDPQIKPSTVMMVYGEGGVGKSTFASTSDKPLLADCENGTKYFGLRGIKMPVALIEKWQDMNKEFLAEARKDQYETIIIDPIGELMDKIKSYMINVLRDNKLVQRDGSPTAAGWGWMKTTFKDYLKILRDCGKNILLIAHIEEKTDEGRIVKRPKIETKIANDIRDMVDVVGYMTNIKDESGQEKRIIIVDPGSDRYVAKDRTGQLGKIIEPDFSKIVKACQGTEIYSWSKKSDSKGEDEKVQEEVKNNNESLQNKLDTALSK